MKKYLLSIICTLLPIFAWGADGDTFTVQTIEGVTMTFSIISESERTCYVGKPNETAIDITTSGVVTIPEMAEGYSVIGVQTGAFAGCINVTQFVLPETLRTIGDFAFRNCSSLTTIELSDNITDVGSFAFADCKGLSSVYIPKNVKYIGPAAFGWCNLDYISVDELNPYLDSRNGCNAVIETNTDKIVVATNYTIVPENVRVIGDRSFAGCEQLQSISLPSGLTEIQAWAFGNCIAIHDIYIPQNVSTIMDGPFSGCSNLNTIVVDSSNPNYDSRNNCNGIIETSTNTLIAGVQATIIPNTVTAIGTRAYYGMGNLTSVEIPSSVTRIATEAFGFNYSLNTITIPNSVTTIEERAFYTTSNFSTVTSLIENPYEISETAFDGDDNFFNNVTLYVPAGTKSLYETTAGWSKFHNIVELGGSEEAQYWMELRSTLDYALDVQERAQGHPNVEPWMQEELAMMIERGSNMYDEHTADEEEVHHMIEELNWICSEIEEAMNREPEPSEGPVPYAIFIDNNTALEFRYDDQRSSYPEAMDIYPFSSTVDRGWNDMAESIHSVVFNESFANCTTITSTEYWFFGCSNLETFIGLENLNTSNVTNMASMFHGCSSLTSLDLSSFNTTSVTEMKMMFYECPNLTTIYVSSGWSTANVSSSDYMFGGSERIVGGRGTQWNPDYTDAAYAHIDGGIDNPGYLTDINGSGSSDLDQRKAELLDKIDQLMQELDVCHSLLSQKDPQKNSELWPNLDYIAASIYDVGDRTKSAESDAELDECENMFLQIMQELEWLRMKIDEYEAVESEARFDGLTAWVYGDATLDDAFAEVGRESAVQTIAAIVWEGTGALTAEQMQGITNPNLLVYVNDASKAPAGVRNVIVNGTAANITLSDASGNNNFFCPEPFTAQSISYTRNFSQTTEIGVSRGWETIALPFTVQSITHESHGVLEPFGINNGYPFWLRQLGSDGLARATVLEANVPFLICMPNNSVYPSVYNQVGNVTFSSSNVTVPETHPLEMFGANVILTPAFQNLSAGSDIFTLNVGEAQGSYPEGSVFISNYRSVRPFQCYARHSSQARGTDDIQFIPLTSIGGGDDTTAIMEIIQPAANGTGDWYSLDGRKLSSKPTQKGVYIQNGKKIVIK